MEGAGTGCAGDIASLHGRVSHRPSSPPRSPASWQASSGQSPNRRRLPTPDALILAEYEPRRSHRVVGIPGSGGGGEHLSRNTARHNEGDQITASYQVPADWLGNWDSSKDLPFFGAPK